MVTYYFQSIFSPVNQSVYDLGRVLVVVNHCVLFEVNENLLREKYQERSFGGAKLNAPHEGS